MSTVVRPEVSKKNPYYISRHRYYELKHFCMQYKEWVKAYNDLCSIIQSGVIKVKQDSPRINDKLLNVRQRYLEKITLVEDSAKLTDDILGEYILKGVTEGLTYSWLRVNRNIPCCKDTYYSLYRKFFYILSKRKDA